VLAEYLRIDTSNPPGHETEGARFLAARLEREGIASEIVEVTPGRGSLIARLKGSGALPPLCLLSHIDVASAEPATWPADKGPFSGVIDEQGQIWGRGALDMKGMGALELQTLVWLKRLDVPLKRDVVLLAVADEEVDNLGFRHLVQLHWDRIGCSHLVNEGGLGLRDVLYPGQTIFAISVGEKGVLWLRLTAHGAAGHGSTPRPDAAPTRLLEALDAIRALDPAAAFDPSLVELLARAGDHGGGFTGFVLKRPLLQRWLAKGELMKEPGGRAALIDTVNITGLDTGEHEPNVVPSEASALLDARLLPGTRPEQVLARLEEATGHDPALTFEVLQSVPAAMSPWEGDPLYAALARQAVRGRTDAVAGPALSIGFTDSIYARQIGVRAYGFIPFEITKEEAATMHGANERVSVDNVRRGLQILFRAVLEVSADLSVSPP
jgi:acetylornithine deacetylase/succinyl-diaminopimelate desuccinylase-like protein